MATHPSSEGTKLSVMLAVAGTAWPSTDLMEPFHRTLLSLFAILTMTIITEVK